MAIHLAKPSIELLPSYLEAIQEGNFCNMALGFADDSLTEIVKDKDAYLYKINNPSSWKFKLPNGAEFSITDHELYWITDGKRFIGSLPLRYAGDVEFIENFCGHTGMAIRPSLLNKGYGVKALMHAFELGGAVAKSKGLKFILASCDQKNSASKRLIEHAGGKLFRSHDGFCGAEPNLIYQIFL
ncbi:MAG: GNAT family N-acetyltransferase [Candidatus Obscuribacterales bacterium]|nr:GNAT family N-acetyltransferase [Candidatus Obscuribacterales bacterium]